MKKFLTFVLALACIHIMYSQNTLVATLSHGDDITMFYGNAAFSNAHKAAVSGDIINLSGGTFSGTTITKAVTVRGTGIDAANPTIIYNANLDITIEDTEKFMMEGVRCTGEMKLYNTNESPIFQKCYFEKIFSSGVSGSKKGSIRNALFINSKIIDYTSGTYCASHSIQYINCYIDRIYHNITPADKYLNCIISAKGGTTRIGGNSLLVNCIVLNDKNNTGKLSSSTIATNCVAINLPNLFDNGQSNTGCSSSTFEEVFKDFTGTYTDGQTFELTDDAKTKYLGTDGTEVGIHGGVFPYTSVPSYPVITKMNVANKTTADGKLSVDIEVSAAQ